MRIETKIISNLIFNEEYCRKAAPHIKPNFFVDKEKVIVSQILKFFNEFNARPTIDALKIEIHNKTNLSGDLEKAIQMELDSIQIDNSDYTWLLQNTEKFCKDKSVYNAILESINIIDGKSKKLSQEAIPKILQDALSVTFDEHIGHDYIMDADERYEFYHKKEDRLAFDLEMMNKITKGGLPNKSLNVVMAATGSGKSLFLCHVAASTLMKGKNVLYITMEMAEERIAERVDANLLNLTTDELSTIDKESFKTRLGRIQKKTQGKLVIKEYPTASAHSGHFRALIEDLRVKRNFKPDILIVDYLNICASARMKMGGSVNTYSIVKSIAEELRGLSVEYDIPVLSATQSNRESINNSDIDLSNTSESIGLPQTCDFMIALIRSEELDQLNQIMVKQLKSRYNDPSNNKRFVLGVDFSKMKLYDVESSAQEGIVDSGKKDDNKFDQFKF